VFAATMASITCGEAGVMLSLPKLRPVVLMLCRSP